MSSVKIHVIGRLGANAEVKQTKKGKDFSTFTLAVDDFVGGKKTTTWFAVADFTDVAKARAEYLKKGSLIEVQGIETCRVYMDRNNIPQIARDIRATHIDFINTSAKSEEKEETVDCGKLEPQVVKTEESTTTVTTHIPQSAPIQAAVSASSTSSSNANFIDDLPF